MFTPCPGTLLSQKIIRGPNRPASILPVELLICMIDAPRLRTRHLPTT